MKDKNGKEISKSDLVLAGLGFKGTVIDLASPDIGLIRVRFLGGELACFPEKLEIIKTRAEMKESLARFRRNRVNRERNAALRELCGTSARAAREDMGL